MKTHCLTIEEQSRIVGLHKAGVKGVKIVAKLGHPKTTVNTVLKRFERHGTFEGQKSTGRPQKLLERSIRIVTRALATNHSQTLEDITNRKQILEDITNCSGFGVSTSTIRIALHNVGFHNRVAAKKPFLNDAHRSRRLQFAKHHQKWTCEDWKKIIWTDELTFEVGKNLRQIKVWRKSDERYKSDCLTPTFKSGRTSVMIWGAFIATHKLPLIAMPPGR